MFGCAHGARSTVPARSKFVGEKSRPKKEKKKPKKKKKKKTK